MNSSLYSRLCSIVFVDAEIARNQRIRNVMRAKLYAKRNGIAIAERSKQAPRREIVVIDANGIGWTTNEILENAG